MKRKDKPVTKSHGCSLAGHHHLQLCNGKEQLTKCGLRVSALPRRFNLETPLAVGLTAEGIILKERTHKGSPERMHRMAQ